MDYASLMISTCSLLRQAIWEGLQNDLAAQALVPSLDEIGFAAPAEQPQSNTRLSLWLYRVEFDEMIRNRPLARRGLPPGEYPAAQPGLKMWFLITPYVQAAPENAFLLGKVIQILLDRALLQDQAMNLRVTPASINTAEHLQLWQAIQQPYRLSAVYLVQTINIDSRYNRD